MASRPSRQIRKNLAVQRMLLKEEQRNKVKEVRKLLKKSKYDLTKEEAKLLEEHSHIVQEVQRRSERLRNLSERMKEVIDPPEVLEKKCEELANALQAATFCVIYTGAGISTAAKIPDYRGPEGVWTLLRKGKNIEVPDLSVAEPTFTHMAIKQLVKMGIVQHVVSQNCDGLHVRSGLPAKSLSEIHGNMFIEVCVKCRPLKQYLRLFDVTENTALRRHYTGRFCKRCGTQLKDTIVHFGETGKLAWPLNWKGAAKAAAKADLILCLGSSLKVLKRYPCLWANNRPLSKRPKLFIVNLQWTPKDSHCTLKIHAKCDEVMKQVADFLKIEVPAYSREHDPVFELAVPLTEKEKETTTRRYIDFKLPVDHLSNASSQSEEEFICAQEPSYVHYPEQIMDNEVSELSTTSLCSIEYEVSHVTSTLLDLVCSSLDESQEKEDDSSLKLSVPQMPGWYGKGCAKLRKAKRKKL